MQRPTPKFVRATAAAAILLVTGAAVAGEPDSAKQKAPAMMTAAIERILTRQTEAWNRGDIDAFMQYYWKSEQLTFSSGGKTTRGWEATRQNYLRRYPTRETMGQVAFDEIEVFALGNDAALVLGRWKLQRDADPVGGNFSLVLRRIDGQWRIVHDHTSRSEPAPKTPPAP